ncbi:MAG: sigma-70 family RNA polymerase sigma factor [Tepidisphaeraceae bacterium]
MRSSDAATTRFYDLIWPHRDTVLRTARFLTRDVFAADDLAQETMLKAFRSLDQFKEGTNVRAWLLSILRNARIDRARADKLRPAGVSLDALPVDLEAEPVTPDSADWSDADALLDKFADADIIAALQELPDDIRWTLLLVDVEGLDQADAAKVLDVPVGTVKSRTHRGRRMLRDVLLPQARAMGLMK